MHTVLIVVQPPPPKDATWSVPDPRWQQFVNKTQALATQHKQFQILAENVFQIVLQGGLLPLARLISYAEDFPTRTLFFPDEPHWIASP